MTTIRGRRRLPAWILAGLLALGAGACGDNPVGDDHEEHPEGLVILDPQGQDAVSITVGPTVTGSLIASVGGTSTYTVVAVSEDGDRLELDGDELAVRVTGALAFATVAVQGADQLVVTGTAAGSGTVLVELMHEGHPEIGGNVTVTVQ